MTFGMKIIVGMTMIGTWSVEGVGRFGLGIGRVGVVIVAVIVIIDIALFDLVTLFIKVQVMDRPKVIQ